MKQFLFIICISSLIACSTQVETEYREVEVLRASKIFDSDSVYNFIEKFHDTNKEMAASYLKQAEEVAPSNILKAVYFTKRAITLYPVLDNYLLLAKKLEKASDYDELSLLYGFITQEQYINRLQKSVYIFEKPNEDLVYEKIVAEILHNNYVYPDVTYEINELGFDVSKFKTRLQNEDRIKMDKQGPDFKYILLQFLPYEEIAQYAKKPEVFSEFIAGLRDTANIFEIDENNVQQFSYEDFNGINYGGEEEGISFSTVYEQYLAEKQNDPNKWLEYNFLRTFQLNDKITVVEYAIDSSATACPKEMRHIYHRIATYDRSNVTLIDSKIIAYQSGEQLATVNFNKNNFTITESKRTWKKPYSKHDFDNDLLSVEKLKTSGFSIAEDGTIKEILN
jgi:hypothetical protein